MSTLNKNLVIKLRDFFSTKTGTVCLLILLKIHKELIMFGLLKMFYYFFNSGFKLINPNTNPLKYAPIQVKYIATILLACFWCLAFGVYFKKFEGIGYNMFGHIAVISMAFITWGVFKLSKNIYGPRQGTQAYLRTPDFASRCDELTDEERLASIETLNKKDN
jgi:hypothetical protein